MATSSGMEMEASTTTNIEVETELDISATAIGKRISEVRSLAINQLPKEGFFFIVSAKSLKAHILAGNTEEQELHWKTNKFNEDIVLGPETNEFTHRIQISQSDPFKFLSVLLKPGLSDGSDYYIITEDIWRELTLNIGPSNKIEIQRQWLLTTDNSWRVEVYPIRVTSQLLFLIDRSSNLL
jgi:hypothetical protein